VQNDHFNPQGFGLGAAVGVGALAFTLVNGVVENIRDIQDEHRQEADLGELFDNMNAVIDINREQQRIINQQAAMINEMAALISAMSARLFAAEQD
jgi:hypothetical protein